MATGYSVNDEEERNNFFCLTLLLFRTGNNTLRRYFKTKWPAAYLKATGTVGAPWTDEPYDGYQLISLDKKLRVSPKERAKALSGNTAQWDFTLLTKILLFSSLQFTVLRSKEFDALQMLKCVRNDLIAHAPDAKLRNSLFKSKWQDVCKALTLFGAQAIEFTNVQEDTKKPWHVLYPLVQQCADQEQDISNSIQSILCEMYTLTSKIDNVNTEVTSVGNTVNKVAATVDSIRNQFTKLVSGVEAVLAKTQSAAQPAELGRMTKNEERFEEQCGFSSPYWLRQKTSKLKSTPMDATFLKDHYQHGQEAQVCPLPWTDNPLFQLDTIYMKLKVIQREPERFQETNEEVDMYDVFKSNQNRNGKRPRTLLIEGSPGIGKTTFCHKMTHDWARGILTPSHFPDLKLILLLKCRDMTDGGLCKAIEDQLLPEEFSNDQRRELFEYIKENQKKVLLIFDGYDEIPDTADDSVQESLMRVISGKSLSHCHVIVTSRHETGLEIRRYFDALLEIKGFQWKETCQFIKTYFHSSQSLAESMIATVLHNPGLKDMVCNPLNTALLCAVFEDNGEKLFNENGVDRAGLYHEILYCVASRNCKKEGTEVNGDIVEKKIQELHSLLGKPAFHALKDDRLYFGDKHIPPDQRKYMSMTGILYKEKSAAKVRPEGLYYFSHKTMQEYFAAVYLAEKLKTDGATEELCFLQDITRFKEVNRFLVNILGDEGYLLVQVLACGISSSKDKKSLFTFICELLTECGDKNTIERVVKVAFESFPEEVDFQLPLVEGSRNKALAGLCYILSTEITASDRVKARSPLSSLNLKGFWEDDHNMFSCFVEALSKNTTLTELNVSDNHINPVVAVAVVDALIDNTNLTHLNISRNRISNEGAQAFVRLLIKNKTLTHLNMSRNFISSNSVCAIATVLEYDNNTLTWLDISRNNIRDAYVGDESGDKIAVAFANVLRKNRALTSLDISNTKITYTGGTKLAHALKMNKILTCLKLSHNYMEDRGTMAIACVLNTLNTTLKELDLSDNGIGPNGARFLAAVLSYNGTLEHLDISNNFISRGGNGTNSLAKSLRKNDTLTKLIISGNEISGKSALYVAEAVTANKSLTYLDMSNNYITDRYADSIITTLTSVNTFLTELDISDNDITDIGIIDIAQALTENTTFTLHIR